MFRDPRKEAAIAIVEEKGLIIVSEIILQCSNLREPNIPWDIPSNAARTPTTTCTIGAIFSTNTEKPKRKNSRSSTTFD